MATSSATMPSDDRADGDRRGRGSGRAPAPRPARARPPGRAPAARTACWGTRAVTRGAAAAGSCRGRCGSRRRGKPAPLPEVEDQDVGADEQQHQRLDHRRQVAGELRREDVRVEAARRGAVEQGAEQQRREEDADRRVAPEHGHGDAGEADRVEIWTSSVAEPELPAEHVHRAAEAGERARDRHRQEVAAPDADAAVAGRLGVAADGADAEARGSCARGSASRRPGRRWRARCPMCRPCSSASPQITGSFALSTTSFEIGTDAFWSFCRGPPSPNR